MTKKLAEPHSSLFHVSLGTRWVVTGITRLHPTTLKFQTKRSKSSRSGTVSTWRCTSFCGRSSWRRGIRQDRGARCRAGRFQESDIDFFPSAYSESAARSRGLFATSVGVVLFVAAKNLQRNLNCSGIYQRWYTVAHYIGNVLLAAQLLECLDDLAVSFLFGDRDR